MNPEAKVVSQPLAKRMQELGWKHETERVYVEWQVNKTLDTRLYPSHMIDGHMLVFSTGLKTSYIQKWQAPDLSEILERLPINIETSMADETSTLTRSAVKFIDTRFSLVMGREDDGRYWFGYGTKGMQYNLNPAEAAGLLWCWCVEKGYVKA